MAKVSRTLKVQVYFPGMKKADLKGKTGLYYQIAVAQGEIARAANQTLTALYLNKRGHLETPINTRIDKETGKPKNKPYTARALAFRALNGSWQPFKDPMYKPSGRGLSSAVLVEAANAINSRLQTDFKGMCRGTQQMPIFKVGGSSADHLPLTFPGKNVELKPNGHLSLPLWEGRRNNRITVAASGLRKAKGKREILQRLIKGEYKLGSVKLFKDSRTHKWSLAISWTGDVKPVEGNLIAGIDIGIVNTVTVAYISETDGKPAHERDFIQLPGTVIRTWNRIQSERRNRQATNRKIWRLREGRGRARKLRVSAALGDKLSRLVDTAVKQTAAAVVRSVIARGAKALILENLVGMSAQIIRDYEKLHGKKKAAARKWFIKHQMSRILKAIHAAAEREGLEVRLIPPAYTSKTCSECGTIWTHSTPATVAARMGVKQSAVSGFIQAPTSKLGRINQATFKCSCGFEAHADRNAAVNIARRGKKVFEDEAVEAAKKAAAAAA